MKAGSRLTRYGVDRRARCNLKRAVKATQHTKPVCSTGTSHHSDWRLGVVGAHQPVGFSITVSCLCKKHWASCDLPAVVSFLQPSDMQTLQDRAKQMEAATSTSAATTDATMADLRIQLEAERAEARRAKMEASSTVKQYEALVQRLRREADASECRS